MANQIKTILDGAKISLEKQASDKFGAAVEEFTRGSLGSALGLPPPEDPTGSSSARNDGSFYASSYASALAGGTSYRPKLKFLFKVEFVFTEAAKQAFPDEFGKAGSQDFTFMIKSVDRPKIDFEYDEVNMYNFYTKVLKKIRHRELTMTFMDDTGNRVINFFRALMMLHSPITRRQMTRQTGSYSERLAPPEAMAFKDGNGMDFSSPVDARANDTAIRGSIGSEVGNAIQSIRIKQIYVNPGSPIAEAAEETIFDFMNARLVSFDLDDLSHEGSDANLLTMQFDYDWMEIVHVGALQAPDGPAYNIAVPGIHGAPTDVSPAGGAGANPQGAGNGFSAIVAGALGRAGQQVTSTAINRAVKSVAGGGRFATLLGSQASNILGGVVGAATRNLGNGLAQQASEFGSGLVNQAGAAFTSMNVIRSPSEARAASSSVMSTTSVGDSAMGGRADIEGLVGGEEVFWSDGSWLASNTTIKIGGGD